MREHIDFVQTQRLNWEDGAPAGLPGTMLKLLSRDDEDGSYSAVVRLPTGWSRPAATLHCDEEFYLLEGALLVGDYRYGPNAYGFLAAGISSNGMRAESDVTMLYFRSGTVSPARRSPEAAAARTVRRVDLTEGNWDGDFDKLGLGSFKGTARMKILREDPLSGETTYISATIAFRRGERAERHPIVQEFYMLSGELAGDLGVMHAGAYCFRPPMIKHGPYCTPTGAVILFRGLGGKQETYWEDAPPITFDPPHQPILPERLKHLGAPYAGPPRY